MDEKGMDPPNMRAAGRERAIGDQLARALEGAGWRLAHPRAPRGPKRADLVAVRRGAKLAVHLKVIAEGRADRLIPLWSQAWLQAQYNAPKGHVPMAVVGAERISEKGANAILGFIADVAPHASAGVIDASGFRRFRGPHAEGLDGAPSRRHHRQVRPSRPRANLFSDKNQWMLKVLLAPKLPEHFLSAPRGQLHGPSELGEAAGVSAMSASRLLKELREQRFLDADAPFVRLVRVRDLLEQWRSAVESQPIAEEGWKVILRGRAEVGMGRWLELEDGCLALFAAAKAHGLGFVEGVPPHLYPRRWPPSGASVVREFAPAAAAESPDFFVRKPSAPVSVFRGLVEKNGRRVCDILQVWLDVGAHPSRGREQADHIWRRVLAPALISADG